MPDSGSPGNTSTSSMSSTGTTDSTGTTSNALYSPPAPQSSLAGSVPQVPGVRDIQVEPGKVLAVATVLEEQANALDDQLRQQLAALRIDPPAEDIVSTHAVDAWNQVIADGDSSYAHRVREYVAGLRELAHQLRTAGELYEADDEAKAAAFQDRRVYEA
jgi:hypothetical protein